MADRNGLKRCRFLVRLLEAGQVRYAPCLDGLLQAGILARRGGEVEIADRDVLEAIVREQCLDKIRAADKAVEILVEMGIDQEVNVLPEETMTLAEALRDTRVVPGRAWNQQLSASLFGDSKFIRKHAPLLRVYETWARQFSLYRELRIKAFSSVRDDLGNDLENMTRLCGQVVFDGPCADNLARFDLASLPVVVTCENLAPFLQLTLPCGVLAYTAGYAASALSTWLSSLPRECSWIHFGDFDPDGLHIFENISTRASRKGRFFPDLEILRDLEPDLAGYPSRRTWNSSSFREEQSRRLAAWGREHQMYVEQETIMAVMGKKEGCGFGFLENALERLNYPGSEEGTVRRAPTGDKR
jgi:hypothetical protein